MCVDLTVGEEHGFWWGVKGEMGANEVTRCSRFP